MEQNLLHKKVNKNLLPFLQMPKAKHYGMPTAQNYPTMPMIFYWLKANYLGFFFVLGSKFFSKHSRDISRYHAGGFDKLLAYLEK